MPDALLANPDLCQDVPFCLRRDCLDLVAEFSWRRCQKQPQHPDRVWNVLLVCREIDEPSLWINSQQPDADLLPDIQPLVASQDSSLGREARQEPRESSFRRDSGDDAVESFCPLAARAGAPRPPFS